MARKDKFTIRQRKWLKYYLETGTAALAYPLELITKKPPVKEAIVDIDEISWNRIEDYIFRWYPVLQNLPSTSVHVQQGSITW